MRRNPPDNAYIRVYDAKLPGWRYLARRPADGHTTDRAAYAYAAPRWQADDYARRLNATQADRTPAGETPAARYETEPTHYGPRTKRP